jgi:hypothetical protein
MHKKFCNFLHQIERLGTRERKEIKKENILKNTKK